MRLHIIATGGTIDSHWDPAQDAVVVNETSEIPSFVKSMRPDIEITSEEVAMKDSRAMSEEDLKQIVEAVEKSPADKILITHGTYTMPDSAIYVADHVKREGLVVIITGSLSPLKGFENSDAPKNIEFALAKLKELQSGVYISLNGVCLSSEEVKKYLEEGKLYDIFPHK